MQHVTLDSPHYDTSLVVWCGVVWYTRLHRVHNLTRTVVGTTAMHWTDNRHKNVAWKPTCQEADAVEGMDAKKPPQTMAGREQCSCGSNHDRHYGCG